MVVSDTARLLWQSGAIGVASSVINGLLLYSVIRFLKFGNVSALRSVLASLVCSAIIILGFVVPAVTCSYVAGILSLLGVILGIVLTFPIQSLIFRLSVRDSLVVWVAYLFITPFVVCITTVLSVWTDIF
jgi:uncharacterized membrane protein